jgi:hypothetical protein
MAGVGTARNSAKVSSLVETSLNDHPVARRIRRPGPKRILALDGGGSRGVVALAFLKRMETILAAHYGTGENFRLRDHFDMIGGTSVGSVIATALALGWPVDLIRAASNEIGWGVMRRRAWRKGIFKARYSGKALEVIFSRQFGDAKLGSRDITCALVIVTKRLDTGSVWMLHNNPFGRYYDRSAYPGSVSNKDLPLYQLVRASGAAPTFFAPETIEVLKGNAGFFVDGAVSPFNNPALLLFLVATTPSYGYGWKMGEEALQIISVGTGSRLMTRGERMLRWLPAPLMGTLGLASIMEDCSRYAHMTLQAVSTATVPWVVDREAGALDHEKPADRRLLSYTRLQLPLERKWLEAELGQQLTDKELDQLARLDNPAGMDRLYELGVAAAGRMLRPEMIVPIRFAERKPDEGFGSGGLGST